MERSQEQGEMGRARREAKAQAMNRELGITETSGVEVDNEGYTALEKRRAKALAPDRRLVQESVRGGGVKNFDVTRDTLYTEGPPEPNGLSPSPDQDKAVLYSAKLMEATQAAAIDRAKKKIAEGRARDTGRRDQIAMATPVEHAVPQIDKTALAQKYLETKRLDQAAKEAETFSPTVESTEEIMRKHYEKTKQRNKENFEATLEAHNLKARAKLEALLAERDAEMAREERRTGTEG
jgi:hypothetical protein